MKSNLNEMVTNWLLSGNYTCDCLMQVSLRHLLYKRRDLMLYMMFKKSNIKSLLNLNREELYLLITERCLTVI